MSTLTPEMKATVEKLRGLMQKMGITDPMEQADQIGFLIFLKLLDEKFGNTVLNSQKKS